MSSRKSKRALAPASTVLSACAEQQPQSIIQNPQSGDGALTCERIVSPVRHLVQIAYGSQASAYGMKLANAATEFQTVTNTATAFTGVNFLSAVPMVSGVMTAMVSQQ